MTESQFDPRTLQQSGKVKAYHWEKLKVLGAENLVRVTEPDITFDQVSGYFSLWTVIAGKDPDEIRRALGLRSQDLRLGANVFKLLKVPNVTEFEVRGYTHYPDGLPLDEGLKQDASGYPPGTGGLQYKLIAPVRAQLVCTLRPGEKLTVERFRGRKP